MPCKVEWDGLPREVERAARPAVRACLPLLPGWMNNLVVRWSDKDSGAAQITTDYRYRCAKLEILPGFLDADADTRKAYIVHEFAHLLLAPYQEFTRTLMDGEVAPMIGRLEESALEQATEDTATALLLLMG